MNRRVGALRRTGRWTRRVMPAVFAAFAATSVLTLVSAPTAPSAAAADSTKPFEVVGKVPIYDGQTPPGPHQEDGWLVIDPATRRGYQFFYTAGAIDSKVSSFDLDDYTHKQTMTLPHVLVGGACSGAPCATTGLPNAPGDVPQAVDEVNGKIYVGALTLTNTVNGGATNLAKQVTIMEIDEAKFEAGAADAVRHIRIPATQLGELTGRDLMGIDLVREGTSPKLLLLFSGSPATADRKVHEHWLARWDIATGFGDWTYNLQACARAPMVVLATWAWELPILRGKDYITVPCQATHGVAQAVRIPINAAGEPNPDVTLQQAFPLPRSYGNAFADPASERLIFQTEMLGSGWWVFDAKDGAWVGSVGASLFSGFPVSGGLDPTTGRLYHLIPDHYKGTDHQPVQGGFGYSDIRLTPAPQAQNVLPEIDYPGQFRLLVDPEVPGKRPRRIFTRRGNRTLTVTPDYPGRENSEQRPVESEILVIADRQPVPTEGSFGDIDQLTINRKEEEGVTEVGYNGVASGFGTRVLLVGGVTAATARDLDSDQFTKGQGPIPATVNACYRNDRELVFGKSEARTTELATSALSIALDADQSTKTDLGQPGTQCPAPGTQLIPNVETGDDALNLPDNQQQFLAQMIDSNAGQRWDSNGDHKDDYTVACSGDTEPPAAHVRKDVQEYDANAACGQHSGRASASSSATIRPDPAVPIRISDSSVTTDVGLDPKLGMVSTVTSTVRGVEIAGVGSIGLIQATATSYAHGVPKSAHATLTRTFCAVSLPNFKMSGCTDDPSPAVRAINLILGRNGEARLRAPDENLQEGSPGGYQSAIQRDPKQAFTDQYVTRDSSLAVPAFELIIYRNDNQTQGAGRQVFQFAGTQASSSYAIKCLLGKTDDGKDCATLAPPDPGNLKILLTDQNDQPLKGGVFKVHRDADGDGTLGIDDPVISNGTCATEDDGIGSCHWEGLDAEDYIIEQSASPAGYTEADDLSIALAPGAETDVHFFNVRSVGGVLVGLVSDDGKKPLEGGGFELYQDDGDGAVGPTDRLYASCTTDGRGLCQMELPEGSSQRAAAADPELPCYGKTSGGATVDEDLIGTLKSELGDVLGDDQTAKDVCVAEVPLGTYLLHQSAAPDDYQVAPDLPLELDLPGELALVLFTNGLAAIDGTEGTPGSAGSAGAAATEPAETVTVDPGAATPAPIVQTTPLKASGPSGPRRVLDRIFAAPASALRFLFSKPRELGLMAAVWAVIWLPCYLAERRRLLRGLRDRSSIPMGVSSA